CTSSSAAGRWRRRSTRSSNLSNRSRAISSRAAARRSSPRWATRSCSTWYRWTSRAPCASLDARERLSMSPFGYWQPFPEYVSAAERRRRAEREATRLAKKGRVLAPIKLDGKRIASTFWGQAWCENLESYSDYSNRLPRGRTYVRNGSVLDLKIA